MPKHKRPTGQDITQRDLYNYLLLTKNQWDTVGSAAVVATAVILVLMWLMMMFSNALIQGAAWGTSFIEVTAHLFHSSSFLALLTVLTVIASLLAKVAAHARRKPRFLTFIPFIPMMVFVFTSSVGWRIAASQMEGPVLDASGQVLFTPGTAIHVSTLWGLALVSAGATYGLWKTWWWLFELVLKKSSSEEIWVTTEAIHPEIRSALDEFRHFVVLKRDAALAKKRRGSDVLNSYPVPHCETKTPGRTDVPISLKGIVLVLVVSTAATFVWKSTLDPSSQAPPVVLAERPKETLTFWYSGTPGEVEVIQKVILEYNMLDGKKGKPLIDGHHVPNLGESVLKAGMSGYLPDILLAPEPLATNAAGLASKGSMGPMSLLPIWTQSLWRPELQVVLSDDSLNQSNCREFAVYLRNRLKEY